MAKKHTEKKPHAAHVEPIVEPVVTPETPIEAVETAPDGAEVVEGVTVPDETVLPADAPVSVDPVIESAPVADGKVPSRAQADIAKFGRA